MTRRRLIIAAALSLVLLPAFLVWFLLYTEPGARWALGMARDATDEALGWQSLEGSISGGLTLGTVSFVADGVEFEVNEINAAAKLTLLPLGVTIKDAGIRGLRVSLESDDQASDAEIDIATLLESLRLPLRVSVQSLTATGVSVASDGATLISLERIQLSLDWHETIELHSFAIDGGPALAATGNVTLGLTPPFALDAGIDARADATATGLPTPVDGTARLGGSLAQLDILVSEGATGLDVAGTARNLLDNPAWDLEATVSGFTLDAEAGIGVKDAELSSAGTLDDYRLEAALEITGLVDATPLRVDASAGGSALGLEIELLELSHPTGQLAASGHLDFPAAFSGPVEIRELRLDHWLPGLDAVHVLSGRVDTDATTERLTLHDGRFLIDGTDIGIDIGGTIDLASGNIDARVQWQAIEWPLGSAEPRIQSRDGKAQVSGTLDAWKAEVSAVLAAPDIAESRLVATGSGSRSAAEFDIVDGEVFGGAIDGSGRVDWANELRWSGEAIVRGLRTAAVFPAYPGILTTHLRAASKESGPGIDIELVDLRGTVLDETLSGGGHLSLAARELTAREFRVAHGDARLELDGSLFIDSGLSFDLAVPDLGLYRPSVAGDVHLEGRISLRDDAPMLALEGTSSAIRAGEFGIESLRVSTSENESGGVDLGLVAAGIAYGTRRVEDVTLDAVINADQQRITMSMMPLGNKVTIAAQGSMSEPGKLSGFPWAGTLEEFTLVTREDEGGGLIGPVPIVLAPGLVRIDNLCVSGERRGELCATVDFETSTGLTVAGALDGVPLDVLNAFLQTGFGFEQTVSGSLSWDDRADGGAAGKVALKFTPGQLKSARFPNLDLRTGEGEVSFEVAAGQLLSGKVSLPLGTEGYIDGEFNADDITLGTDSPIRGALSARTRDVDVFAVLLPDIDGAEGDLRADLSLGGTMAKPLVTGTAAFNDGKLNYFPLGLVLTDINVDGRFDENRHVDLSGTFRAGEGQGEISTTTSGEEGEDPGIHVRIRGDGLRVVELPDISAVADADLTVDYRARRLDINGSIDIPRARIRPVNLVTARVDESQDVVIVAGTLPDEVAKTEAVATRLAVHGKLALGVGNDVQVILDVARASIDGRADFEWSGDPVPIGRGRYNINGTVEAFGQVLNISEGRVSFPGVPATEPLLDIRATREIYGNTQIKRAGVLVQGSVQRPTIEAYTYPITTEERALTLLVTGNDFDYEQGVGAIDFGTYIAPRLFLSYGVGVFERENIISARYDLTTGFGIRATSGSRDSGVDLTYRLER